MSEEKGNTVSEKPKQPGPLRVSATAYKWLKNEQNRVFNETDVEPSFAEIIDGLIDVARRTQNPKSSKIKNQKAG